MIPLREYLETTDGISVIVRRDIPTLPRSVLELQIPPVDETADYRYELRMGLSRRNIVPYAIVQTGDLRFWDAVRLDAVDDSLRAVCEQSAEPVRLAYLPHDQDLDRDRLESLFRAVPDLFEP